MSIPLLVKQMHNLRLGLPRSVPLLIAAMLLLVFPQVVRAQGSSMRCLLLVGAGSVDVRDYEVVFSASPDATGSTIDGLVVVRASKQFRRLNPRYTILERYRSNPPRHPGGGANVGSLDIIIDAVDRTVWVNDSVSFPFMPEKNVLLLDVDPRGAFTSAGQAQVDRHFPPAAGECYRGIVPQGRETSDTLWSRFQASPAIRKFVER